VLQNELAFLGQKGSFSIDKIGGTDALVRRISEYRSSLKLKTTIVLIGYNQSSTESLTPHVSIFKLQDLRDATKLLKEEGVIDVCCVYLRWVDRVSLRARSFNSQLRFHSMSTVYHLSAIKRFVVAASNLVFFNGLQLVLSDRLAIDYKRLNAKVFFLRPPVDEEFMVPSSSHGSARLKVAYMGRLDYEKGADIAFSLFSDLKKMGCNADFTILGYAWKSDPWSIKLETEIDASPICYVKSVIHDDLSIMSEKLAQLIDSYDVFVLPYRSIASTIDTPLVPLEVMARGKHILTTDFPPLRSLQCENLNLLSMEDLADVEKLKLLLEQDNKKFQETAIPQLLRSFLTSYVNEQLTSFLKNN